MFSRKKIIITILSLGLLTAAFFGYKSFTREETTLSTTQVKRADIKEQISVTGSLVPLDRIQLEAEKNAPVQSVGVKVGDKVKKGQLLVALENNSEAINLQEAKANLATAKQEVNLAETRLNNANWNLEKISKSASSSIKEARANVESASSTLKVKKQNLEDIKSQTKDNLDNAYQNARDALEANYLTADEIKLSLNEFEDDYFQSNDQTGLKFRAKKRRADNSLIQTKKLIDTAVSSESRADTVDALKKLKDAALELKELLVYTRNVAFEDAYYETKITAADESELNSMKTRIETVISNLNSSRQTIESKRIASKKAVNAALGQVKTARANLNKARESLDSIRSKNKEKLVQAKTKITETKQEIEIRKSKVETAQTRVSRARESFTDTRVNAPFAGTITKVNIDEGEIAKPGVTALTLLPDDRFKIEADVSEVDIGKMEEGDSVMVDFDAYPEQKFKGRVTKIYPTETVREGVVYYRIEAQLENYPKKLRSGLTANLEITTRQKKDTLVVPYVAVKTKDGDDYVEIMKSKDKIVEKQIEVGIESDTMVEVKSGLSEG